MHCIILKKRYITENEIAKYFNCIVEIKEIKNKDICLEKINYKFRKINCELNKIILQKTNYFQLEKSRMII